jgi:hypothetical protein
MSAKQEFGKGLFGSVMQSKKSVFFEFAIVFLIAILARGNMIFGLSWSCDDLLSNTDYTGSGYVASQAAQLRVFAALATWLTGLLGIAFPPLGSFWNAAHTASIIVFALALRRLWIPGSASIYGILIGLLFSLFPYHINLLSFQLQHPSMVMSYLTGAYAVANVDRRGWRRWLSVLAIAASLSYQTMIAFFIAAGLILFLIVLFRRPPLDQGPIAGSRWQPLFAYFRLIIFGSVAYLVLSLLAVRLAGIPVSSRTTFAAVDAVPQKLQLIVNHIKRTAFGKEPSLVRSSKLMQTSLWALVGAALIAERWRSDRRLHALALVAATLVVMPLLIVASAFLPTILMDHTSENPRNLLATVVFAAGGLSLSSLLRIRALRLATVALAAGMALSYAFSTNALSVDQARLTSRDLLQATRMVERLEQARGDKPVRSVVLVGTYTPATDLRGSEYYQSAFQVPWAKLPMLREATGQVFQDPSEADRATMLKLAAGRQPWPAKDSVAVQGDVGLIVLSKP